MSVLYALGEPPTVVMEEAGHTDAKLALRIYARAMRRSEDEKAELRALVNGKAVEVPAVVEIAEAADAAEPIAREAET
jgi:acyl-CoA reductase-like NAD-dependent aldehyde dehydrogenase